MGQSIVHDPIVVEPLSDHHEVANFVCGRGELDAFLKKFARNHPRQGLSRTWVALGAGDVIAYYTLSFATIMHAWASARVAKGAPRHDLPVILLARLAVDRAFQGQGFGRHLLEHALRRCLAMADAAMVAGAVMLPVRAVLVHATDEAAARFYRQAGFEPSPTDALHLMMTIKDLRRQLQLRP